jgi:hypothetical protein
MTFVAIEWLLISAMGYVAGSMVIFGQTFVFGIAIVFLIVLVSKIFPEASTEIGVEH